MDNLTELDVQTILNGVVIPPRPSILAALVEEQLTGNSNLKEIISLISSDIGLSSAVLRTINSAAYNLRVKVISIERAVSLLGMKNLATLATALTLHNVVCGDDMEDFWTHSARTALITSFLAQSIGCYDKCEAHLFGLFHDCGQPLMMHRFVDYQATLSLAISDSSQNLIYLENSRHRTNHAQVGAELAKAWNLPSRLCDAILLHHRSDIFRVNLVADDVLTLVALVHLSEYMANGESDFSDNEWEALRHDIMNYLHLTDLKLKELSLEAKNLLIKAESAGFITPIGTVR